MEFHCIKCGSDSANLTLELNDCNTLNCPECGTSYPADEIDATVKNLQHLLRIVRAAKSASDAE